MVIVNLFPRSSRSCEGADSSQARTTLTQLWLLPLLRNLQLQPQPQWVELTLFQTASLSNGFWTHSCWHLRWSTNWAIPAKGVWFSTQALWQWKLAGWFQHWKWCHFVKEQNNTRAVLELAYRSIRFLAHKGERPFPLQWCVMETYAWAYTLPAACEWLLRRNNWMSDMIQNGIREHLPHAVRCKIVSRASSDCTYYGLTADGTTVINSSEQFSLFVLCWSKPYWKVCF